jgi:DNA-binding NarL/FixJ family response regulator
MTGASAHADRAGAADAVEPAGGLQHSRHPLRERHNRWWSTRELRTLHDLRTGGASRRQIAAEMGRTVGSVKAQLGRYSGVIRKPKAPKRPVCPCCKRAFR